jgi:hypothetical protein
VRSACGTGDELTGCRPDRMYYMNMLRCAWATVLPSRSRSHRTRARRTDGLFFIATNELKDLEFHCNDDFCAYPDGKTVSNVRARLGPVLSHTPGCPQLLRTFSMSPDDQWTYFGAPPPRSHAGRWRRPLTSTCPRAGATLCIMAGMLYLLWTAQRKINHIKR